MCEILAENNRKKKKTVNKYDSSLIWDKDYPGWRRQEENDCIKLNTDFIIHLH